MRSPATSAPPNESGASVALVAGSTPTGRNRARATTKATALSPSASDGEPIASMTPPSAGPTMKPPVSMVVSSPLAGARSAAGTTAGMAAAMAG